ncbi:ATP-binding protein, partial [Rhodothermus sp. AH-315-K08]|nr:ATP-binding protein [Rhodothermus sp. AH-315-K08]
MQLTWEELNLLVARSEPEGPILEFKGALSDNKWATEKKLSGKARDALARELIGFANTNGGRLILGVTDEDDRAGSIANIPDVADLAGRLEQCLVEVIDPPHFAIRIQPVSDPDDQTAGVIVFDCPVSSVRPHRLLSGNNEVFVRNGKETKPVRQMRQIHDMVIAARNQHIEVQKRLRSRFNEKQAWAHQRDTPYVRISAVPVAPVSLPDLSLEADRLLFSPRRAISHRIDGGRPELDASWPEAIKRGPIRPVLGGVQRVSRAAERQAEEILREHYQSDGLVEVEYVGQTPEDFGPEQLDPSELIFLIYFVLRSAQRLYGGQAQEVVVGGQLIIPQRFRGRGFSEAPEQFSLPETRLSISGDLDAGVARVLNDLRNAGGQKSVTTFEIL